jgi:hypothetical protein
MVKVFIYSMKKRAGDMFLYIKYGSGYLVNDTYGISHVDMATYHD